MYHSKNIDVDPDEMEHGNMYDELMERLISDAGNLFKIGLAKIIIENNYSETSKTKIQMNYQQQLNESKKLKKSPLIKLLLLINQWFLPQSCSLIYIVCEMLRNGLLPLATLQVNTRSEPLVCSC